jgi:tubulin epsilon
MNGVVASLLTDLTASARFPGSLNVDLNEITTNLVPFPRLHYLIPALSPLRLGGTPNSKGEFK